MAKFTVLDLASYFNAGRSAAGWHPALADGLVHLPAGDQTFWGIPFALGPATENGWLLLDSPPAPAAGVSIPLAGRATFVVFAHFCDESHDPTGRGQPADYAPGAITRPGEMLADYALIYADGGELRRPIRRRFEIGEALIAWGQQAFAARAHVELTPLPWRGPYPAGEWGWYQTAVGARPAKGTPMAFGPGWSH